MRKRTKEQPKWQVYVLFIGVGTVIILALAALFSLITTYVTASPEIVTVMANVALCVGCIAAGYGAAKKRRKHGLITGLLTGAAIYLTVYVAGVIVLGRFASMTGFGRFIMVVLCGAIGGVIGV
ncbi:MAG: TIGR04086 family membrane protein, partial [Oscillospiraceae bacterium]|nr:TIGR04086 family membrane protein [Oscillospiraceae bacterium]